MNSTGLYKISIKQKIKACNTVPATIPGGMNKLLKPLDIAVNRSFKPVLHLLHETWIVDRGHGFTTTGRMRHKTFQDVVKWINTAWSSVTTDTILSGFRQSGLLGELKGNQIEEETQLHFPLEFPEMFKSGTEDEEFNRFSDPEIFFLNALLLLVMPNLHSLHRLI